MKGHETAITSVSTPRGTIDVRRRKYSRWRAASLIAVHVLITLHIVHWLVAGKTLAPLELNEVMYTAELGIVTAGFLFMVGVAVTTLIFGRFFCSWGCHILALQDLSAWLLLKVGIRPKVIRSRLLLWVPALAAGYMFLWPQALRVWRGEPMPILHVREDTQGWASFTTENFWRNLPSPGIAVLTFLVVGPLIVYVLGSRSFCAYGCPYGAVFGLVDRFAPGKIRLRVGRSCDDCGICTAVCSSHIRVHEEVARHGMVVNSRCLKDLDCVAVCPDQSLQFAFGRPSVLKPIVSDAVITKHYEFTWREELAVATVVLATLFIYRGLYDRIPFLMTLGLAGVVAYGAVVAFRLVWLPDAKLQRLALRSGGSVRAGGWIFILLVGAFAGMSIHSAYIQYHTWSGRLAYYAALGPSTDFNTKAPAAIDHLDRSRSGGLLYVPENDRMIADLHARSGRWAEVEQAYRRLLFRDEADSKATIGLALALARQSRHEEAVALLREEIARNGTNAELLYQLAGSLHALGNIDGAIQALGDAVRSKPTFVRALHDLGASLLEVGDSRGAVEQLRRGVELEPKNSEGHYNLALALWMSGAYDEARREINEAFELNPADEQTRRLHGLMHDGSRPGGR